MKTSVTTPREIVRLAIGSPAPREIIMFRELTFRGPVTPPVASKTCFI